MRVKPSYCHQSIPLSQSLIFQTMTNGKMCRTGASRLVVQVVKPLPKSATKPPNPCRSQSRRYLEHKMRSLNPSYLLAEKETLRLMLLFSPSPWPSIIQWLNGILLSRVPMFSEVLCVANNLVESCSKPHLGSTQVAPRFGTDKLKRFTCTLCHLVACATFGSCTKHY